MRKIVVLAVVFLFTISLGVAWAADRKSGSAKGPLDTFAFQPFFLLDKAMTPPADYEKRFHTTIEQEMQQDHLKAKAKAKR